MRSAHRAVLRQKRARDQLPPDAPAPVAEPTTHPCDLCDFVSTSKGGLTTHYLRTHRVDRREPKPHRPSNCQESAAHLLFECPALQALRLQHGIGPREDVKTWFNESVPKFLFDALSRLRKRYECSLCDFVPPPETAPPTAAPTPANATDPATSIVSTLVQDTEGSLQQVSSSHELVSDAASPRSPEEAERRRAAQPPASTNHGEAIKARARGGDFTSHITFTMYLAKCLSGLTRPNITSARVEIRLRPKKSKYWTEQ